MYGRFDGELGGGLGFWVWDLGSSLGKVQNPVDPDLLEKSRFMMECMVDVVVSLGEVPKPSDPCLMKKSKLIIGCTMDLMVKLGKVWKLREGLGYGAWDLDLMLEKSRGSHITGSVQHLN